MSEALVLATKAGVDPSLVYQAIRGGLRRKHSFRRKSADGYGPQFQAGFSY
ncbi:hypothetical protein O1V64_01080 [Rouxiella badensis]|nr:hypothetical protein O1V64_01080 [Rouxiella badensis]